MDKENIKELFLNKEDISSIDNWVHKFPLLLKQGRFSYFYPPHRNEEERDDLKDVYEENDAIIDRLRQLNEDRENLWYNRFYGD